MATHNPQATGDFVMMALEERAAATPTLAQYKSTATAILSTLVTVAAVIVAYQLELPAWVMTASILIVGAAEASGIRFNMPEPTPKQREMVRETIARKIDAAHGVSEQH